MNTKEIKRYLNDLEEKLDYKRSRALWWKEIAEGLQHIEDGERVQTSGEIFRMEVAICEYLMLEDEIELIRDRIRMTKKRLARLEMMNEEHDELIRPGIERLAKAICKGAIDDYKNMHVNQKRFNQKYKWLCMVPPTPHELREFLRSDDFYLYSGGMDGQYVLREMDRILNVSYSE